MSDDTDDGRAFALAFRERKRTLNVEHRDDPVIESMRDHIETAAQWTFFDFGFKNGSEGELMGRTIPESDFHKVVSIYATNWYNIGAVRASQDRNTGFAPSAIVYVQHEEELWALKFYLGHTT